MAQDDGKTPANSGAGDPPTGAPGANVKFVTPEDFDGFKSFLNKDLAGHRKELGTLAASIKEVKEMVEQLKSPPATGNDKSGGKDLPTAEIERKVKSLEESLQKAEKEKADALISTAIADATAGAVKESQDVLRGFLRGRARVENGVVVVDAEDGPIKLTPEWVRKNTGDFFYPATGKSGTGMTGGGAASGTPGIDVERGLRDQAYWNEHQTEILQEIARRRASEG